MKFPPNSDINLIIRHALHMKEPKKYPRPDNIFVFLPGKKAVPIRRPDVHASPQRKVVDTTHRHSTPSVYGPSASKINGIHAQTAKHALSIAAASHNLGAYLLAFNSVS